MFIHASGRKAMYVLHKLYDNCSIYLNRKYERFIYFCRIFEKSNMLKQINIGEGCDANTEITTETKESVASQSVELEPENQNKIVPRVICPQHVKMEVNMYAELQ